jgi:hypothetical protein
VNKDTRTWPRSKYWTPKTSCSLKRRGGHTSKVTVQGSYPTSTLSSNKSSITIHRYPERLHLAAWPGPERSYRPPTPRPYYKQPKSRSRYSDRHVDAVPYWYTGDLERRIYEQNARIARRTPHAQSRHFELEQPVRKRVRFLLPISRRDEDELGSLAQEVTKLSIRDLGPSRRRCSRCGQKL